MRNYTISPRVWWYKPNNEEMRGMAMGATLHRYAAAWAAGLLLLLGLLAESAALYQAGLPELPDPARLAAPLLPLRHALGLSLPGQPVTSAAEEVAAETGVSTLLTVPALLQMPALPNGCEVTSLAMVLQSLGYCVTPAYLAKNHMPQGWLYTYRGVNYADDPAECYIGDPASTYGYYMLAPALVKTANSYLASQGGGCTAQDISGAGEAELVELVRSGTPVIIWATMDYGDAERGSPWVLLSTGEVYSPYTNLHCRVLVGVDETYFYINDPIYGANQAVTRAQLLHGYEELGCQAVIVTRRSHITEIVEIADA